MLGEEEEEESKHENKLQLNVIAVNNERERRE